MRNWVCIGSFVIILLSQAEAQSNRELSLDAFGKLWAKDYPGAIIAFNELIEKFPGSGADLYYARGKSNLMAGNTDRAISDFLKAEELGHSDAYLMKARCYATERDKKKALYALNEYIDKCPDPDILSIKHDPLFLDLHESEEWFLLWQDDRQDDEMKAINEASFYLQKKNFVKAHQSIERIIEDDSIGKLYAFDAVIYEKEGNYALALNEINHSISLQPANARFLRQKADYLFALEKYQDAFALLSSLRTSYPMDFDLRLKFAEVALRANELGTAEEEIRLILRYSGEPEIVFLGARIEYALGNYVDALKLSGRLLEADSSRADYFKIRGMTYYKTRTYKQASYDLSMSLDLDPDDPEVNYFKGLAEIALGKSEMGCYYVNRAISSGYLPAIEYFKENCGK
jgi:tetratricopeptide (TPR) repeat protein